MKKLRFINKLTYVFLLALSMQSCSSVWVPDPVDPRLPEYTESGHNVAGALVNNDIWESHATTVGRSINAPHFTNNYEGDSLVLQFYGTLNSHTTCIAFYLGDRNVSNTTDLKQLENQVFELDGESMYGMVYINGTVYRYGAGQLYIKYVQLGDDPYYAIASGTFGFTLTDNGKTFEVYYGRFDYLFNI